MYPVNLLLDDKPCLVLGGGKVALQKVRGLLAAKAAVTVLSPILCPALSRLWALKQLQWLPKTYTLGDEKGYFLLLCATDDSLINETAAASALKHGLLVNVVDRPEQSNWTSPSVIRQGDLQVTISTNGQSPAFARWLRKRWQKELTPVYKEWLKALAEVRLCTKYALKTAQLRQEFWRQALTDELMAEALSGNIESAQKHLLDKLDVFLREKRESHDGQ